MKEWFNNKYNFSICFHNLISIKSPNNNSTIKIGPLECISNIIIKIRIPPSFCNNSYFLIFLFSKIYLNIYFISFYFSWILYYISYFSCKTICFFSIFLIIFCNIMIWFKCLINNWLYYFFYIYFIKSII